MLAADVGFAVGVLAAIAVSLAPFALITVWLVHRRRACHRRIREWAQEKGYAILDIRNGGRSFVELAAAQLGVLTRSSYRVLIQDDQGGQTTVSIYFGWRVRSRMDVRFG